jgi:hypothetical protein
MFETAHAIVSSRNMAVLTATLTCPMCGHQANETMPLDRCLFFHECL